MTAIGEQAESVAGNIVALTETAQSIGEIIAGVNDIAERSDLLALTAAIEAAAAGESGQSFSVIADEMQSLANQAKESTSRVRGLLGDIQPRICAPGIVRTSVVEGKGVSVRVDIGGRR